MSRRRTLLIGWALALIAIAAFVQLGLWQSRRAVEKQAVLDRSAEILSERRPQPAAVAFEPSRASGYDWIELRGRFAPGPAVLLDQQQRGGRVGVRAYRLFHLRSGGEVLVELGWRPLPGDRALPPTPVPAAGADLVLRGLLMPPPSAGLRLGPAMVERALPEAAGDRESGTVWLATRLDLGAVDAALGDPSRPLAARVLRPEPAMPMGYVRDLELLPNTLTPDKHRGYALQWFGLAAAVLVTATVLTFRKVRR